jgi:hypothetical protein
MLLVKIWPDEVYSIDHTWCDKALAADDWIGVLITFLYEFEINTFFFDDHFFSTV